MSIDHCILCIENITESVQRNYSTSPIRIHFPIIAFLWVILYCSSSIAGEGITKYDYNLTASPRQISSRISLGNFGVPYRTEFRIPRNCTFEEIKSKLGYEVGGTRWVPLPFCRIGRCANSISIHNGGGG